MSARIDLSNGSGLTPQTIATQAATLRRLEQRAWLILLAAFFTWCGLVIVALNALLSYRATAAELQWASIDVARGVASYQTSSDVEPRLITRENIDVLEGTTVRTGPNSQAILRFFEGTEARLLADSELRLAAMRTGRFDPRGTRLGLELSQGPVQFEVSGKLTDGDLTVALGSAIARLQQGEFLLWETPDRSQLSVYRGQAEIEQDDRRLILQENQRALAAPEHGLHGPLPLEENLLTNGDFSRGLEGWRTLDDLEVANDSLGQRQVVSVEINGQRSTALRVSRTTALDRHNKTGVFQEINRDVRGYRSLKLRARLQVNYASLDGGGYAGTEYPMSFVVYYVDDKGGEPNWMHGFFYHNADNRPAQFGQQVQQGIWYDYEVELLNQPDRPAFIKSLWVFGAGHDFDALVTDLELVAR